MLQDRALSPGMLLLQFCLLNIMKETNHSCECDQLPSSGTQEKYLAPLNLLPRIASQSGCGEETGHVQHLRLAARNCSDTWMAAGTESPGPSEKRSATEWLLLNPEVADVAFARATPTACSHQYYFCYFNSMLILPATQAHANFIIPVNRPPRQANAHLPVVHHTQ